MSTDPFARLSRRERQIMTILYDRASATAAEVRERLPDPPSYSAVRSALALLEERGLVRHERSGRRYVFHPAQRRADVTEQALRHVARIFFGGSAVRAAAALMEQTDHVTESEYRELRRLLEQARDGKPHD